MKSPKKRNMKTIKLLFTTLLMVVLCAGFNSCKTGEKDGVPSNLEEMAMNKFAQKYNCYYSSCYVDSDLSYTKNYIGANDKYVVSVSGTNPETGAYINIIYRYEKDGDSFKCTGSTKL